MLSNTHFYHRVTRKLVIAFGNMFNNLKLVRYNLAGTTEIERITVPISYASKEKFYKRITEDPNLANQTQTVLPRMAFSMDGLSYDPLRKISSHIDNFGRSGSATKKVKFVPYNFDFNLHIFVRNTEDGTQIIEQILPYFAPDYTLKVDFLSLDGLELDIPIVFNSISVDESSEGSPLETRVIVWTLNFTVKAYLFSAAPEIDIITKVTANVHDDTFETSKYKKFNMNNGFGDYKVGELVYQGKTINESTASGFTYQWNTTSNTLVVQNTAGTFVVNANVIGAVTGARYNLQSLEFNPNQLVNITVVPSPNTANAWNDYGFTTTIEEYPDIV